MTQELLELEVVSREVLADSVVGLTLRRRDGGRLPRWTPGAHIDLHLQETAGPLVRQYSLCGDPNDRTTYRLGILYEEASRGGSRLAHTTLEPGVAVTVSAPRNNFALEPAKNYVFIAGGVGITPILPMVEQAERDGADWLLLYGGRTRGSMAFADDLERYGDHVRIRPEDEYGLLDLAALFDGLDTRGAPDCLVYCCGPEPLLDAAERAAAGFPTGALHTERFVNTEVIDQEDDHAFDVELSLAGMTVRVEPGVSILESIRSAGVPTVSSCQQGTCGTCETFVVAGDVDHRDSILTEDEKRESEVMMICVSRCRDTKLVLEL